MKSELLQYSNKAEEDKMDKSKLKDLTKELKGQLEAEKLVWSVHMCMCVFIVNNSFLQVHTLLQSKLDSTESDLEAARAAERQHEQEESSWKNVKKTLESDLDNAEAQLDKTKVKLDAEKKARCVLWWCVSLLF